MENAEFKKIVRNTLTEAGFEYRNKNYYCSTNELIAVIDLQKSNFSDAWYINYGFYIKAIHDDDNDYPKWEEIDVDARILNPHTATQEDLFELTMDSEEIEYAIKEGLEKEIFPILENGIEKSLEIFPWIEYVARKRLKDYLGIEY